MQTLARPTFFTTNSARTAQPSPMVRMRQLQESGPNSLLEVLMVDLSQAALHTAIVASCFNGLATGQTTADLRCTLDLAPREPALVFALRQEGLVETGLSASCLAAIRHMFTAIMEARSEVEVLFVDAEALGEYRAVVVHARNLTTAWRSACRMAQTALQALMRELATRNPQAELVRIKELTRLLSLAALGASPCLDAEGLPVFAELPRRPRPIRYAIGQACQVVATGRQFEAFAKDISASGMGLERTAPLRVNDVVTIVLASGRQFGGSVAWIARSSAGIQFVKRLPLSDPLLCGCP